MSSGSLEWFRRRCIFLEPRKEFRDIGGDGDIGIGCQGLITNFEVDANDRLIL